MTFGIKAVEGLVVAAVGATHAMAAWTVAEQIQTPVINESTLIPVGLAVTVLGISMTATYKLARWMSAKEAREKERDQKEAEMVERIEKLEQELADRG